MLSANMLYAGIRGLAWHKGISGCFFQESVGGKRMYKANGRFFVVFPLLSVPSMVSALDW